MSSTDSAIDKVASQSAVDGLAALSRATYLLFALFAPLVYGLLAPNETIKIFDLELQSQFIPLVVFPLLIAILIYACHCLSIIEQFIDKGRHLYEISDVCRDSISLMLITHSWPFNPFADFFKYRTEKSLPFWHQARVVGRCALAYLPFYGSYILVLMCIASILTLDLAMTVFITMILSIVFFYMINHYRGIVAHLFGQLFDNRAERLHFGVFVTVILLSGLTAFYLAIEKYRYVFMG